MKVALLRSGLPNLLPMVDRSKGMHVSEVIADICTIKGRYKSAEDPFNFIAFDPTKMELGCSIEHAISHRYSVQFPSRYVFGLELELDGLYGTADIIDVVDFAVEEIKLTWISVKRQLLTTLDDQLLITIAARVNDTYVEFELSEVDDMYWQFLVQLMAYCKQLGTLIGRLHLCHVSFTPIYNVWEFEFTQEEIDDNWLMLTCHRDRMLSEGYIPKELRK